jgi:hypothetical protein
MLPSMLKVAPAYLDNVFKTGDDDGLAWLSSMVCAADTFQPRHATYGLSQPLFVLVEGLLWFAQSVRSGVRTYFESTPVERQQAMLHALDREAAPESFSANYRFGTEAWQDPAKMSSLDDWIDRNDDANTKFLWGLARLHRSEIEALIAES